MTEIGKFAFDNCHKLLAIEIPQGLKIIGRNVFNACQSLTYVAIPTSVVEIGDYAFSNCKSLTSIIIPEGVTSIGEAAFAFCTNLISISIPKSVNSIGNAFVMDCDNLKKIFWKCSVLPQSYGYGGAVTYTANNDYASSKWFKVYPMLGNMFEVDGVTYIPTSMSERTCDVVDYDYYRIATSVNVGATVTYKNVEFTVNNVNDYTFYGNQYLEEASFANLGGIGVHALAGSSELASVNIAEGVTSIGDYAFYGCNKLSSLALPASVTSIGKALFNGCNGLTAITVAEGNAKYDSRSKCNAIVETETNKLVAACNKSVIPRSVTEIGDYAFSGCGKMASVTIHEGILSIGDYAFTGCSSLADAVIENRTEVLALGSNGSKAMFSDCPLVSVYIGGKIAYNTSSSYGYSPFSNNVSLRSVTITDKEEAIYPYEFYNCSALTDVTIGDGVTTIGDYAFSGCTALERFAFGSSMKTIGAKAFLGCGKMTEVASSAVNPPVCGDNALDDLDKWNCTLYTPVGYKAAYLAADQWKEFLLIEDTIPIKRYALTYMVDDTVYHVDSLAYSEVVVAPDGPIKEGHTFSSWVNLPETMPITDVTVIATFVKNKYLLSYVVDGVTIQSDSVAYGTEIVMKEAPEKSGYTFDGWDKTVEVMPAEDVVINGSYTRLPVENFFIIDGNDNEFSLTESLQCNVITYTRTLSKTNTWNALYIPFEIPVTAEFLEDYDVAYFNDIHSFDNYIGDKEDGVLGADGVIDRMEMEVLTVQEGAVLNANYPYLIRAKNENALNMNIVVENATLYKAVETTVSCSSVFMRFDVTGIYTTQTSGELKGEFNVYAMSGGGWKQALNDAQQLKPFRLYLKLTSIEGSPVKVAESAMSNIRIRLDGEGEATGIESTQITVGKPDQIYDLQGRRVEKAEKGIYIINGKKVVIK